MPTCCSSSWPGCSSRRGSRTPISTPAAITCRIVSRLCRRRRRAAADVDHLRRAHPRRAAMTPAARLAAAIEVFEAIEKERRPAADALKSWGLAHRFAGSGDRAAIAGLVYDALRRRASSAWIMGADSPRAILLGMLKRERGLDTDAIEKLADGVALCARAAQRGRAPRARHDRHGRRAAACAGRLSGMARAAFHARLRRRPRGGGRGAGRARAARPARQHAEGGARPGRRDAVRLEARADALVALGPAHPPRGATPRARPSMPSRPSSKA